MPPKATDDPGSDKESDYYSSPVVVFGWASYVVGGSGDDDDDDLDDDRWKILSKLISPFWGNQLYLIVWC